MGLGFLTRDQIITQGLLVGGNPGLAQIPAGYTEAPAVTFFKSFLHHVCLTRDFPWLLKDGVITTGTNGTSYEIDLTTLTRFRSIKSLKLDGVTNQLDLVQDWAELKNRLWADLDNSASPTGIPTQFAMAPDKTKAIIWPIPAVVYTGKIIYYTIPDVTIIAGNTIVDFEDSSGLIDAVATFARSYDEKVNIIGLSQTIADQSFGEYRVSVEEINRVKPATPRLDPFRFRYQKGD